MSGHASNGSSRCNGSREQSLRARLRRVAVIGLAACGIVAAIVLAARWFQHDAERDDALHLVELGKFDDALPLLRHCLQRSPDDVDLLRAQATGAMKAGRQEAAKSALDQWCAVAPQNAEPYLTRIDFWLATRQLPAAIADAARVLELRPDDTEVRRRRAEWLLTVGEFAEADIECRRCLELRPGDLGLVQLQAEICHSLGDATGAQQSVEILLRRDANNAAALTLQAALYIEAGKPEQAIPLLRRAVASGRERQQAARHYLSLALSQTGQHEEARRVLAEMQQLQALQLWQQYGQTDNKIGLQIRLAESMLATGRADEAIRLLEQVLAQCPNCPAAHQLLADYYQDHGSADKAARHREQAQEGFSRGRTD